MIIRVNFKFKIQNNFFVPYTYMYIVFLYNKVKSTILWCGCNNYCNCIGCVCDTLGNNQLVTSVYVDRAEGPTYSFYIIFRYFSLLTNNKNILTIFITKATPYERIHLGIIWLGCLHLHHNVSHLTIISCWCWPLMLSVVYHIDSK